MNKTRVSKAYRGGQHVGFKKTVAGREWFLVYGISPADEARAISLAEVLDAKWKLIKACGGVELSQTDFEDAKALIAGQPRWASARLPVPAMAAIAQNASRPSGRHSAPRSPAGCAGC